LSAEKPGRLGEFALLGDGVAVCFLESSPTGAVPAIAGYEPLGSVWYTDGHPEIGAQGAPQSVVALPQLGGESKIEVWLTSRPPRFGRSGEAEFAHDGRVLFGRLAFPEADSFELEQLARQAYVQLLAVAKGEGYPHLLRIWNCVPRINQHELGLERYQAFCRARANAFEEHYGTSFEEELCAATGVGSAAGGLAIHFLAGLVRGRHCENQRQLSAYRYPRRYGPRSPSFARATLLPDSLGAALLISGTASIVGHSSRHGGDVGAQLRESLLNIDALLAGAPGERAYSPSLVKVYVRHREHLEPVRHGVERWLADRRAAVLYLNADLCRKELLVEIEAVAT
jgi:chorismate lyase/3-hydroxybenzoate synthase